MQPKHPPHVKQKTMIIALAILATPAAAQETGEHRKVTLTVNGLSAVTRCSPASPSTSHRATLQ